MLERWRRETPGGFEEAIYFFGAAFFLVDFLVTFFAAFGLVTFLVAFFAVFGAMMDVGCVVQGLEQYLPQTSLLRYM